MHSNICLQHFIHNHKTTRMHSSRMRNVRCSGRLLGGGDLPSRVSVRGEGDVCLRDVCQEGVCQGGGGVCQTPPL